jgi:hypothetical protein
MIARLEQRDMAAQDGAVGERDHVERIGESERAQREKDDEGFHVLPLQQVPGRRK